LSQRCPYLPVPITYTAISGSIDSAYNAGVHARRRSSVTRDSSHIASRPPAKRAACPATGPDTLCSTARPAPIRINSATSNGRSIVRTASRQPPNSRFHSTRVR